MGHDVIKQYQINQIVYLINTVFITYRSMLEKMN